MRLPLEFFDQIRNTLRISSIVRQQVALTKKGKEYSGICPFHAEKTPSFTVNDAKRFYHCFGCNAHGDVIKFISETNGISYKNAAIKLANDNNIELPQISQSQEKYYKESDKIYEILEIANEFFQKNLENDTIEYLKKRGLTTQSIKDFSIGFAPGKKKLEEFFEQRSIPLIDLLKSGLFGRKEDGRIYEVFNKRIMFPIRNTYNKVVGFGGRSIGDIMPKYINSPETMIFKKSEIMYGENIATSQSYKHNFSILVEGYMDVIALHQAGFKQAVASLGTSVTEQQIQKLWRCADEIITCLDGDNAGIRARMRLIQMAMPQISADKILSFIELPDGLDPDDLIKKHGQSSFHNLLNKRISLSEMIWQTEFKGKIFKTAESRSLLEKKLNEHISLIKDQSLKANYKQYFREMIWNNLIRKKSKQNIKDTNSKEIFHSKQLTEIEYLENAICAFMLKFPNKIKNIENSIQLQDVLLDDFKNWIIDLMSKNNNIDSNMIECEVKNTRFYDSFRLLLSSNALFLDYGFLNNDENINQEQVFEWLCKKHYLLLLKNEYINVSKKSAYNEQSKAIYYIEEIKQVTEHLNKLSDNLIKDQ